MTRHHRKQLPFIYIVVKGVFASERATSRASAKKGVTMCFSY